MTRITLLDDMIKVIEGNRLALIDFLFNILQRLPLLKSLPGMYELLVFKAELELMDDKGRTEIYRKIQKVRFIQDNIIACQDRARGDGNIFANYKCSPGIEVDRYREGHRYNVLISLRETKQRDDEETLQIEHTICNGFVTATESLQVEVNHRTRHLDFRVTFPASGLPTRVSLIEQNNNHAIDLDRKHCQHLLDGRYEYVWKTANPRLFESYIMRWEW